MRLRGLRRRLSKRCLWRVSELEEHDILRGCGNGRVSLSGGWFICEAGLNDTKRVY